MKSGNWLRTSFEDPSGKASHKRLTVFALVFTIIVMAYASLFGVAIDHAVLHSMELLAGSIIGSTVYQNVKSEKKTDPK